MRVHEETLESTTCTTKMVRRLERSGVSETASFGA